MQPVRVHEDEHTLDKLYACLKNESPAIEIPQDIARDAVKPIIRMLEMS